MDLRRHTTYPELLAEAKSARRAGKVEFVYHFSMALKSVLKSCVPVARLHLVLLGVQVLL